MVSLETSDENGGQEDFYTWCRRSVAEVLEGNGWYLVEDFSAFVSLVITEAEARAAKGVPKSDHAIIVDSTIHCYAAHWYHYCCSDDWSLREEGYRALGPYIEKVIWHTLQRYHEVPGYSVDDLRQAALEQVTAGIHTIRTPGTFLAWVRTTTWRLVKDLAVRKQTESVSDEELDTISIEVAYTDDTMRQLDEAIHTCIPPGKRRTVIRMFYLADMTIKEIAEAMSLSAKQVVELKSRGLARLRKCQDIRNVANTLRN